MSNSAERLFDVAAKGWEMTSQEGRQGIVSKILSSIGNVDQKEIGGVDCSELPLVNDYYDLPESFQGYLFVACTTDGWDYKTLEDFAKA